MLRWLTFCASWLAIFPLAAVGTAATIDKTNNTDGLNLGSSWVGATVPGSSDVARWSSVVAGANTVSLGADTNWLGIKVTNPGGAVTVNSGNTLTLGGSGIDMSAATTNLTLNCGLTLLSNQAWNLNSPAALTLGGTVGGANVALSKAGSGTANLNSLNTISGSVAVNAGRLVINHPRALGFTAATVVSGAQLYIGTASACTNAITLTGNGTDTQGAVRFNGGTAVWSGPITLVNGARIGGYAGSGAYTLSGGIGGTGDLRIWAGGASYTHVHTFTISAPCSYTGDTVLETYAACPVVILSGGANRLPTNSVLTMLAGVWNGQVLTATLKLNANSQAFAGLTSGSGVFGAGGTNRVVNGGATIATLTINGAEDKFFDGALGGPGANENNFGLTKNGAGKLTIKDNCTQTGPTLVNDGILSLLGAFNGGTVAVSNGAMLLLGNGAHTMAGLTLSTNSALGVNVGAPANPNNTVIQVNGNLVLGGTIIVQDLGDAGVSNVVTVINYTGTLSNLGLTTDSRSPWTVQADTSTSGKVKLTLQRKLPTIEFTTASTTVSNSLQFDMQGVLRGFPLTPVWYEVHTPDGQLWDFGAMPPAPSWTIHLRHLRLGTNNVRAFTLDNGNLLEQDTRQVVLQLGTNPPVRPRPYPAEIWWGGVATDLTPDYGYAQLVDPARPWSFVQQYQDGIFLHGILPTIGTLAKLAAAVAPYRGRFGREDGYYTQADTNFGFKNAAAFNSDLQSLAGAGLQLSFQSMDYSPGVRVWAGVIDPGWCQKWPNWTHAQIINSNMQCWADFVGSLHTNWPGLKLGMTWSPVWFNWGGHPALVPSGDSLTLHPVTDAAGTPILNQYGTNAWFDFDMQEFFNKASATAQAGDGYYGFASDCPYDYFATWSNITDRTNNQAKILGYEAWERTNGYFPTTICNYSTASGSDTNAWDASYMQKSYAYISTKQQMGGRTQKYLFESWYSGPYTWAPESNTNSFSGMVKQAIKYLKGISDTNGTLESLDLIRTRDSGSFQQVQLQNNGDIQCLPALVALPGTVPGVTTRFFTTNGYELTASLQTAEGLCFTNLLRPGAATDLVAVTTASGLAASTNESASLEAFWNPQDPLGIVRDRDWLTPTLDPLRSWQSQDIGGGGLPGGVGLSSNVFSVIGSGTDIGGTADAFRFVYLPVTGDATITARVSAQLNSDSWAKAGVMVRESLAAGARNVLMAVTPGNGVMFQYRGTTNGSTASTNQAGLKAPYWVRLVRASNSLSGYYSSNGTNWSQLSSTVLTNFGAPAYFGLAVSSHNTNLAGVAVLDSVTVAGSNTNHPPVFNSIPNRTIVAGYALQVPVADYVTDTDSPPQVLTFNLLAAPTNAALDSATGLFIWRPLLSQAPLVTSVRLAVADNGSPPLSATQSFWVTVRPPSSPRFGSPGLSNGWFTFMVDGDAGPDYFFLGSTNLVDWWPIWTNCSAMPPFEFGDPAATNANGRFYRARLGP